MEDSEFTGKKNSVHEKRTWSKRKRMPLVLDTVNERCWWDIGTVVVDLGGFR